jgi:hypothetical protein
MSVLKVRFCANNKTKINKTRRHSHNADSDTTQLHQQGTEKRHRTKSGRGHKGGERN